MQRWLALSKSTKRCSPSLDNKKAGPEGRHPTIALCRTLPGLTINSAKTGRHESHDACSLGARN